MSTFAREIVAVRLSDSCVRLISPGPDEQPPHSRSLDACGGSARSSASARGSAPGSTANASFDHAEQRWQTSRSLTLFFSLSHSPLLPRNYPLKTQTPTSMSTLSQNAVPQQPAASHPVADAPATTPAPAQGAVPPPSHEPGVAPAHNGVANGTHAPASAAAPAADPKVVKQAEKEHKKLEKTLKKDEKAEEKQVKSAEKATQKQGKEEAKAAKASTVELAVLKRCQHLGLTPLPAAAPLVGPGKGAQAGRQAHGQGDQVRQGPRARPGEARQGRRRAQQGQGGPRPSHPGAQPPCARAPAAPGQPRAGKGGKG